MNLHVFRMHTEYCHQTHSLKTNAIKLFLNPPVNTLNRNLALAPSSAASQGP